MDKGTSNALSIDLGLAHSIKMVGTDTCYVIEQNGREIVEVSLSSWRISRRFSLPENHLFYGHASFHGPSRSLLLTTTAPDNRSKDAVLVLSLDSWSVTRVLELGTIGMTPHDVTLTEDEKFALVSTKGATSEDGARHNGAISLLEMETGAIVNSWHLENPTDSPAHFSKWWDKDSVFFTVERQRLKHGLTHAPTRGKNQRGKDDHYKIKADEIEYLPSYFGKLSLGSGKIDYFKTRNDDPSARRPFNIFWSHLPEFKKYVVVNFLEGPGVWVWDMEKKKAHAHMIFNGARASSCICADGKSILVLDNKGGYLLQLPNLNVLKKIKTAIPPGPHPILI